eukprot:3311238-Prymnesium_polylepis.1
MSPDLTCTVRSHDAAAAAARAFIGAHAARSAAETASCTVGSMLAAGLGSQNVQLKSGGAALWSLADLRRMCGSLEASMKRGQASSGGGAQRHPKRTATLMQCLTCR